MGRRNWYGKGWSRGWWDRDKLEMMRERREKRRG